MNVHARRSFEERLDLLSKRIDANIAAYRRSGQLADEQESYADYLRNTHVDLRRSEEHTSELQ